MDHSLNYKSIVLDWQPDKQSSRLFHRLVFLSLLFFTLVAFIIYAIEVPEKPSKEHVKIPTRIANFVAKQPIKLEPIKVIPPEMKKEIPRESAQETISREKPQSQDSSLSERQKESRQRANNSGILALKDQFDGLVNTSSIETLEKTSVLSATDDQSATHRTDSLTEQLSAPSKSINRDEIVGKISSTEITQRQSTTQTMASTLAENNDIQTGAFANGRRSSDIGHVFNKNKLLLHALYERERRKDSSLKGKIIFQLTILPSGKVSSVKIIMTELSHQELELRLISRIRGFVFSPTNDKNPTTIEFPVEFIPS